MTHSIRMLTAVTAMALIAGIGSVASAAADSDPGTTCLTWHPAPIESPLQHSLNPRSADASAPDHTWNPTPPDAAADSWHPVAQPDPHPPHSLNPQAVPGAAGQRTWEPATGVDEGVCDLSQPG